MFESIVNEIDDPHLLGNTIYTMWKKIMLYQNQGFLLSEESRSWFILALERLCLVTGRLNSAEQAVIVSPAYQELVEKIKKLRTELAMLLLEKDALLLTECVNIENDYLSQFGGLENNIYKLQIIASRLARKIELIQTKKNRQEDVDLFELDEILNQEFKEKKDELHKRIKRKKQADRWKEAEKLTSEEMKELKNLYYAIVKYLHPDLHPNQTQKEKLLFNSAVNAYKEGDLSTLRMIKMAMRRPEESVGNQTALEELEAEKDYLEERIDEVKRSIREIMTSYPYTMKEILADEKISQKKRNTLQSRVDTLNEKIRRLELRITRMLRK